MGWRARALALAAELADQAGELEDALEARLAARFGRAPLEIITYRTLATPAALPVRGRVLTRKTIPPPGETPSRWRNAVANYLRFSSDELPGATVRATLGTASVTGQTDAEGYFSLQLPVDLPLAAGWQPVSVALLNPPTAPPVRADAAVLVADRAARLLVISDIDDTIIRSDITHLLHAMRQLLLGSAADRQVFPGVPELLQALHAGVNPVCYVSSSPWNLYDLLTEVFDRAGLPSGPLLLRDWGMYFGERSLLDNRAHKRGLLTELLAAAPTLPVVLLGDSGQQDPEIYAAVARANPGRIRAIYIRDVTDQPRDAQVQALIAELAASGVPLVYAADTAGFAAHAAALGLTGA